MCAKDGKTQRNVSNATPSQSHALAAFLYIGPRLVSQEPMAVSFGPYAQPSGRSWHVKVPM